jgi:hypothetical protein
MSHEPTGAQIDAAWAVLREEWSPPYMANSSDFITGPNDPPAGPERVAALAALRAADDECSRLTRDSILRALIAAAQEPTP